MSGPNHVVDLSTVIALASFALSGVTLFLTQFRPPKFANTVGPEIQIYYPPDGGLGLYLPVTFINYSSKTGTILRCAVSLFRKAAPEERFFMEWRFFSKLNPDLSHVLEESAHALAISGNSSTVKIIWLTWRQFSNPPLRIAEGQYELILHYWVNATGRPVNDRHEFNITSAMYEELEQYRAAKNATIVNVALDARISSNRLLSSYESRSLLGV